MLKVLLTNIWVVWILARLPLGHLLIRGKPVDGGLCTSSLDDACISLRPQICESGYTLAVHSIQKPFSNITNSWPVYFKSNLSKLIEQGPFLRKLFKISESNARILFIAMSKNALYHNLAIKQWSFWETAEKRIEWRKGERVLRRAKRALKLQTSKEQEYNDKIECMVLLAFQYRIQSLLKRVVRAFSVNQNEIQLEYLD